MTLLEPTAVDQTPDSIAESAVDAVAQALIETPAEPLPDFDHPEDLAADEAEAEAVEPIGRPHQGLQFVTAAVISFSLTLLAGAGIVLAGYVPLEQMAAAQRVDLGAVLLFAPVCALVLALLFEVAIVALKAPLQAPEPRRLPIDWTPGHREG
jgi:hypothetical protein